MAASLSTHVLDTALGRPAAGVVVELYRDGQLVSSATTDRDGRIPALADGLEPGEYRLVFHRPSEFFAQAAFDVRLGDGHYHIPLLISPFACVTYRGS